MSYTQYGWAVSLDIDGIHFLYNEERDAWLRVPQKAENAVWGTWLADTEEITPQRLETLVHYRVRVEVHV